MLKAGYQGQRIGDLSGERTFQHRGYSKLEEPPAVAKIELVELKNGEVFGISRLGNAGTSLLCGKRLRSLQKPGGKGARFASVFI